LAVVPGIIPGDIDYWVFLFIAGWSLAPPTLWGFMPSRQYKGPVLPISDRRFPQAIVRQIQAVLGLLGVLRSLILLGVTTHEKLPSSDEDHLRLEGLWRFEGLARRLRGGAPA
jgi:hypothetical protein